MSNAALSINLKLIVNRENPREDSHGRENPHEDSHGSRPGRRAVRVTKCCECRELFNELKLGVDV